MATDQEQPEPTIRLKRTTVEPPESGPMIAASKTVAPHPREPSDAEQLKTVMDQINALAGGGSTNQGQVTAPPSETPQPSPAAPSPNLQPPASPPPPVVATAAPAAFKPYDVVQVSNPQSRYYGLLFQIGDCQNGQAHGYAITEGGGREFYTLSIHEVVHIGEAKIRARVPCSSKWLEQHKVTQ